MEIVAPYRDLDGAGTVACLSASHGETRREALVRSFWLVTEAQGGAGGAAAAVDRLIEDAERRGWREVVLAGMYAACVVATADGDPSLPQAIERLRLRAEIDADPAMMALALAIRARHAARSCESTQSVVADADLARATVILESAAGDPLGRAAAHNSCAIVYGQRRLWELAEEQYSAAEALLFDCHDSPLPATVLFNRAELQLDWACAMREIDDVEGVKEHCRAGAAASLSGHQVAAMPRSWRHEMRVHDLLLAAVGGADVAERAWEMLVDEPLGPEGLAGFLYLAIALSPGLPAPTALAAELAIENMDPGLSPTEYDLAMRVAAELEAAAAGDGTSAGLRCARRQIELRWGARLSTLAAMESLLQGERLRAEHDRLSRHAHMDDLTGLANRRSMYRYLNALQQSGIQTLAMVLVDVDGFKLVNDRHGHSAGDNTLMGLAAVLTANIRPEDLAVRLGGDEFALFLADTDLEVAAQRAADIVAAMKAGAGPAVSVSIGFAGGPPDQIADITARADAAMYKAKAAGGSRAISG